MPTPHPQLTPEQLDALGRELDQLRNRTVADLGPDLTIGYARGYRVSWDAAQGTRSSAPMAVRNSTSAVGWRSATATLINR